MIRNHLFSVIKQNNNFIPKYTITNNIQTPICMLIMIPYKTWVAQWAKPTMDINKAEDMNTILGINNTGIKHKHKFNVRLCTQT